MATAKHIYLQEQNAMLQDVDFNNPGSEVADFFSMDHYKKINIKAQNDNSSPKLYRVTFVDLNNVEEVFHNCLIVDENFKSQKAIIPINPFK